MCKKAKAIKLVFTSGHVLFLLAVQMYLQTLNYVTRLPQGVLDQDIRGKAVCFPRQEILFSTRIHKTTAL